MFAFSRTIMMSLIRKIILFYTEGFRSMDLGKTLWAIILIKLAIMFFILRIFFFPNFLKENNKNSPEDKQDYISTELIKRANP